MKDFKDWGFRIRRNEDLNYYSIWKSLKTTRLDLGEVIKLPCDKSEFYDVGITEKCNAMCPFCFLPGTSVNANNKTVKIEDIKKGDFVYSYNHKDKKPELQKVDMVFERDYDGDIIEIELENGEIIHCTPNHKLYIDNIGYVEAGKLTTEHTLFDL